MSYGMVGMPCLSPVSERGQRIDAILWRIFRRINLAKSGDWMPRRNFYCARQERLSKALRKAEFS